MARLTTCLPPRNGTLHGQLGTTEKASYSAITPAAEAMEEDFNTGEDFFEHLYTFDVAPRKGLGPSLGP